jgi:hypothetical protein
MRSRDAVEATEPDCEPMSQWYGRDESGISSA